MTFRYQSNKKERKHVNSKFSFNKIREKEGRGERKKKDSNPTQPTEILKMIRKCSSCKNCIIMNATLSTHIRNVNKGICIKDIKN